MSTSYRFLKNTYRRLAPKSLSKLLFSGNSPLSRIILSLKARLEQTASHNDLYDEVYFRRQDKQMKRSAIGIAQSIKKRLNPDLVIDVGCGSGSIMFALGEEKIRPIGLEYADAAIQICREKGLEVYKFDLESEVNFDVTAPLVLSTEVAEHLPASCAEAYVDLLCRLASKTIVMTAAPPGQGGTDHVNEQPNEYWIEKFAKRSFEHNMQRSLDWRKDWQKRSVDNHRAKNVMIFTKLEL